MALWVIDIESYVLANSDKRPTEQEAIDYIKDHITQLVDNADVRITHA